MFQKFVEEDYVWMMEEIKTEILELQRIEAPEEIGGVQDKLAEEHKSTSKNWGNIKEFEPNEEEYFPPPVAIEQLQCMQATNLHGRVSGLTCLKKSR